MNTEKQDKNTQMIKFILSALVKMANLKGIKQLADYLEQSPGKLYGWVRNGKISDVSCILIKFPQVNKHWLETGEGPMLRADAPRHEVVQAVELVASFTEPLPQTPPDQDYKKEDWSMSEMIIKTTEVLESNTVYRSALAANVRAFHQAVQREVEMQSISEKLEVMQEDNRKMAARMERLEDLLLSMGALTGEKKSAG